MDYELIIIGGGPAGAAAGVYAARKKIKTLIVTRDWGGQSSESLGIQNWIGAIKIPGGEFGKLLRDHVAYYAGETVEMRDGESVEKVVKEGQKFKVKTNREEYESRAVLVATGSRRRKLEVPGARELEGKGIVYCASCDGPLFADQDVAVIGGGNAALESAAQLMAYCKSVTLLNRSANLRADPITLEIISKNPKVKIIKNAVVKEIKGDRFVSSLVYEDAKTGERRALPVTGVFVEIGLLPATSFAEGLVEMTEYKQIKVDPKNQRTSLEGVWAAGDATDGLFHQNNIAAGDAVKALEDIYLELQRNP